MNRFCTSSQTMNSTSPGSPFAEAPFSVAATLRAQSLLAGDRKKVSKPLALSSNQLLQCSEMNSSPPAVFAASARASSSSDSSRDRVSVTSRLLSRSRYCFSSRATARLTSFSISPPGPTAPVSAPPCPASITTRRSGACRSGACTTGASPAVVTPPSPASSEASVESAGATAATSMMMTLPSSSARERCPPASAPRRRPMTVRPASCRHSTPRTCPRALPPASRRASPRPPSMTSSSRSGRTRSTDQDRASRHVTRTVVPASPSVRPQPVMLSSARPSARRPVPASKVTSSPACGPITRTSAVRGSHRSPSWSSTGTGSRVSLPPHSSTRLPPVTVNCRSPTARSSRRSVSCHSRPALSIVDRSDDRTYGSRASFSSRRAVNSDVWRVERCSTTRFTTGACGSMRV